ncbi:hypothetical protein B0A58_08725 [Flavobacterium branchiophilum NBRC 15030 = ATCC 35035]|nr:hypothetical protein [Flavobacterium branchiophilum]OXA75454.1 hypothetical protein B0A58_08725 [Flavobacterium branchiophilum NBRC 15030 = ATCC 35035]
MAQNMQGTAKIHSWTADMDDLQSDLVLVTDLEGNFKEIHKFINLFHKWENQILPKLRVKYAKHQPGLDVLIAETSKSLKNKEAFIKSFVGYSAWRFFFQSWYRQHEKKEIKPMLLKGYFGKIDLPLVVSSHTMPISENTLCIENSAVLDKDKFDRKSFARMLKDLTNIYNIDATLTVDMEEIYEMNSDGWLEKGDMFLETAVTNWYEVATAHQIKQVTRAEQELLIEEIKQKNTKQSVL